MSDEVPAQVIVDELFKSRPMVGRTTPMDCWSMNVIRRADASALKTMINRPVGRMLVWSWNAGSGLAMFAGGSFQAFAPGPAPLFGPAKGRMLRGRFIMFSTALRAPRQVRLTFGVAFSGGDDVFDSRSARRKFGTQGAEKAAFIIRQSHRPRRAIDNGSPGSRFGDTSVFVA